MSSAAGVPGTRAGSNCRVKRAAVYQRRRRERSAAYQVVRQNLETWLAQRRAGTLAPGGVIMISFVIQYFSSCKIRVYIRNTITTRTL